MASIADMLIGSALQSSQNAPDISGAIVKGAALGQHIAEIQNQRAQIEAAKAAQQQAKLAHFGDLVSKIHEFKDSSARDGYLKFLQAQNQQLGLGIAPEALQFAAAGPENTQRIATLQTMVQDGTLTGTQAIGVLSAPDQFAQLVPQAQRDAYKGPSFLAPEALKGADMEDASSKIVAANKEHQANLAQAQRAGAYNTQANTRQDEQAAQAVSRINTDHQLLGLTTQKQSVTKAGDILDNGQVSWKMANEVLQDLSSALNPKGGGSDFKLKEFSTPSAQRNLGDIRAYLTSNPDQPANPETVAWLKQFKDRLGTTYDKQIADRADQLSSESQRVFKHSPNAAQAAVETAARFKNKLWEGRADIHGTTMTKEMAQAFLKANPKAKAGIDPAVLKELGF